MEKKSLRTHPLTIGLIGGGFVILALVILAGFILVPSLVQHFIAKFAVLDKDSPRFEVWKNPSKYIEIYIKFYFFNVTNINDFENGKKPILEEVGPFTYLEKRSKIISEMTESTIRYNETFQVHFSRRNSSHSDNERLPFINLPLIGAAKAATLNASTLFATVRLKALEGVISLNGEGLFRTESIRSILFQGINVQAYVDLLNLSRRSIPRSLQGSKFAIYKNKNGSTDDQFVVHTGKDSHEKFGQIKSWNNLTHLPWWNSKACNKIHGSDGTTYPPFLTENTTLYAFFPELCRVISLKLEQVRDFFEIPVYRFSVPTEEFESPARSEKNRCFCTEKDLRDCKSQDGIFSLSACRDQAPVSLSLPNFLAADKKVFTTVKGLHPNESIHKTFFDIEPRTGVVVAVSKRLQFNVELSPVPSLRVLANLPEMTLPVFWVEESFEIPTKIRRQVTLVYNLRLKLQTGRWSFVGVSAVCILLGVAWVLSVHHDRPKNLKK